MSATLTVDVDLWYEQQSAAWERQAERERNRITLGRVHAFPAPALAQADFALACILGRERARLGQFSKTADLRWRQ